VIFLPPPDPLLVGNISTSPLPPPARRGRLIYCSHTQPENKKYIIPYFFPLLAGGGRGEVEMSPTRKEQGEVEMSPTRKWQGGGRIEVFFLLLFR